MYLEFQLDPVGRLAGRDVARRLKARAPPERTTPAASPPPIGRMDGRGQKWENSSPGKYPRLLHLGVRHEDSLLRFDAMHRDRPLHAKRHLCQPARIRVQDESAMPAPRTKGEV